MFPRRYFAGRYFAARYFGQSSGISSETVVSDDLLQFIDSLFVDGTSLSAAFPGGVHFGRAEPSTKTRPYVIVDIVSEVPSFSTENLYSEMSIVQFMIVCDSIPEARTLRRTLTQHATEGLDRISNIDIGASDMVVTARRMNGSSHFDADTNPDGGEAILSRVDYAFFMSREGEG